MITPCNKKPERPTLVDLFVAFSMGGLQVSMDIVIEWQDGYPKVQQCYVGNSYHRLFPLITYPEVSELAAIFWNY